MRCAFYLFEVITRCLVVRVRVASAANERERDDSNRKSEKHFSETLKVRAFRNVKRGIWPNQDKRRVYILVREAGGTSADS